MCSTALVLLTFFLLFNFAKVDVGLLVDVISRCVRVWYAASSAEVSTRLTLTTFSALSILLFDFLCHHFESLLHTLSTLSRSFKERHVESVCKFLSVFCLHFSIRLVVLIANKNLAHVWRGILFNFFHPVVDAFKALLIADIVHDNDALSSTIVACSQVSESFLPCSIPDLKFDYLIVELHCF